MAIRLTSEAPRTRLFSDDRTSLQVILGLVVLLVGTLVYVLDRSPAQVPLLSAISLFGELPPIFGAIGHSLPTFAHVFAFAVLSTVILGNSRKMALWICAGWFAVDAAFEVGQHPLIWERISSVMPGGESQLTVLNSVKNYFVLGTFDAWDLVSIALGAWFAYLLLRWRLPNTDLTHE